MCCLTSEQCETELRVKRSLHHHTNTAPTITPLHLKKKPSSTTPFFTKQRRQGQNGILKVMLGAHPK